VYFVLSADADSTLPPLAMAWAGLVVGSICLVALAIAGLLPLHASTHQVWFLHHRTSWLVPVLGLSLVAAVFAYTSGIAAARVLGAKLSSFVGLSEVLFAVLFAWLLLGQLPGTIQILGGAFIVGGVALVQVDELHGSTEDRPTASAGRSGRSLASPEHEVSARPGS
jgi:drug/metabolite transporter (DMT)-like permease